MSTPSRHIDPLTPSQSDLISTHYDLVRSVAHDPQYRWPSLHDEIESTAEWGLLIAAVDCRDDAKPHEFRYFARRRMTWDVKDLIRSTRLGRRQPRADRIDRKPYTLPDTSLDESDAFEWRIERCRPREQDALRSVFRDGLEYRETARAMGFSAHVRIYDLIKSATARIRAPRPL